MAEPLPKRAPTLLDSLESYYQFNSMHVLIIISLLFPLPSQLLSYNVASNDFLSTPKEY